MKKQLTVILSIGYLLLALVIFNLNPSFGLINLSLSLGIFIYTANRTRSKTSVKIALLISAVFFLSLEDLVVKMQAELLVSELFEYKSIHGITPEKLDELNDVPTMYLTPTFRKFRYERTDETDTDYKWKLEFENCWGTVYFYDDKTGDIEKQENWQGTNHWNTFLR